MLNQLKAKIGERNACIGIIGLGYVGLPLAVEFAKAGFNVTGFENDEKKIASVNKGVSYIIDVPSEEVKDLVSSGKLGASADKALLRKMDVVIICVPTPLRKTKEPDISFILSASEDIAANFGKGKLVVLESTTYPGSTEEILLPKLGADGLKAGEDFCLAFSPERVDPGNPRYKTKDIPKVVGGVTDACTELARMLYSQIIKEVIPVSNTRSAEMVKLLENTFRSVNIGLINELALMCDKMNLDIWEIINAAKTKPFGFMPFYPGPGLGGHCLSKDERIVIKENGRLKVTKISDIFYSLKETPEIKKMYYKKVLFLLPENLFTLSFDMKNSKMCFKKVKCLTERDYSGDALEIKINGGRAITVTDKHPLLMRNGKMTVKFAKDLKPGDEIPLMNFYPEEKEPSDAGIDIAEYFIKHPDYVTRKIRVKAKDFKWKEYSGIITPAVKDKYENYHDFYRSNQIPFDVYSLIKDKLGDIPSQRLLLCTGRGPSCVEAPAYINITGDFCRLMGYYLSEGCITFDKTLRVRFTFNRDEKEYLSDLKKILTEMGFKHSEYNSKKFHATCVKVSSEILGMFFRDILSCGVDSKSMKIPDRLLNLPSEYRKNLLAGLLRGDGGVDYLFGRRKQRKNNKEYTFRVNYLNVNYFSSSDVLFHQVIFLLHSLSIIPTFKTGKNLLTIFGPDNIDKLKGLLGGEKEKKMDLYCKNRVKFNKSRIFKTYEGFVTAKIEKISNRELKKVYSLEVDDTNTFVSSYGIISHNCLPCDPIYLSWKARSHGFEARLIELAAEINSYMPHFVVERVITALNENKKPLKGSNILVAGITYKKDINDLRESPALTILTALVEKGACIKYHDPFIPAFELDGLNLTSADLTKEALSSSDCVVIVTDHSDTDYKFIVDNAELILDTRNVLKEFKGNKKVITL
jgi:UDP-N-acetyl-D-mannosaminuronate dehydrogenase